ncbi:hypothetical protein Tco_0738082 [Tanacetum coccineum]
MLSEAQGVSLRITSGVSVSRIQRAWRTEGLTILTPYPISSKAYREGEDPIWVSNGRPRRGGPSNPILLQSHPSLDITLSLSSITPLDHILDTPSPPSPQPPPQLPLMGHPIYFNAFDYHEVNYLCCFHNRNLIFSLRDEINLMFAHLEYLITSAIALPSLSSLKHLQYF